MVIHEYIVMDDLLYVMTEFGYEVQPIMRLIQF
jgi:hypothetical protein